MRNYSIILIVMPLLLIAGCKNGNTGKGDISDSAHSSDNVQQFPYVEVPLYISDPQQQTSYAARHYWDAYFASTKEHVEVDSVSFQKAFLSYCLLLENISLEEMRLAQDSLLSKAEREKLASPQSHNWDKIISLFDKYLFDPNSPYRNEEYYLPVLEKMVNSPLLSDEEKINPKHLLTLCSLNSLGEKANNFLFTLKNGKTRTLYDTNTDYILLFFSNPGCHNCKEIIEQITNSLKIKQLIAEKQLTIINIYPDEDLTAWYDYLPNYPDDWVNGFDQDQLLNSQKIYNIRAIPSIYLLNKEKEVLYKDAPLNKILDYLHGH